MPDPGENIQAWSTTALTNQSADNLINWLEGQPRASVNNSARGMMAAHAKQRDLTNGSKVTGGTATAITFSTGMSYISVPTGMRVLLKITTTCGASPTLNMDGIGAVAIINQRSGALLPGELYAGSLAEFIYNGTNWVLTASLSTPGQLPATGTNDNAAAGRLGEYQTGNLPTSSPVTLSNLVAVSIVSQLLAAGDWDVRAIAVFQGNPSTTVNYFAAGIGTTVNAVGAVDAEGANYQCMWGGQVFNFLNTPNLPCGPQRLSLAASTTVYLTVISGFGGAGGAVVASGTLSARRVR